jgi:hypothetical protein
MPRMYSRQLLHNLLLNESEQLPAAVQCGRVEPLVPLLHGGDPSRAVVAAHGLLEVGELDAWGKGERGGLVSH